MCDKGFIWNPSNCECDKSCNVGEYLDYTICKCRKGLIEKLVEECSEKINEKEFHLNELISVTSNIIKMCVGLANTIPAQYTEYY